MRLRSRVIAFGMAGFALAGVVVLSGSALGLLTVGTSGAVSVMLTDSPSVPDGVSAVYIAYSGVAVHATGFDNSSGWVPINGQGTVETLGLVNFSQTISTGTIPSLTYNLVRFSITGAQVEFEGRNYTVSTHSGRLSTPIIGGLKVDSSNSAVALIDIHPTVVDLGDQGAPEFAMATGAKALQVPTGSVDEQSGQIGHRLSLANHSWFQSFEDNRQTGLIVSDVTLSPNSFSFTASNQGTDPLTIGLVTLTEASAGKPTAALSSVTSSVVFSIGVDGKLQMLNGPPGLALSGISGADYSLAGGSSHKFTFSGAMTTLLSKSAVTNGSLYFVVVFGSDASISQTVVAA